jgi:hypothetical protein
MPKRRQSEEETVAPSCHRQSDMEGNDVVHNTIQAGNAGSFLLNSSLNGMSNERLVGSLPAPPPDHYTGEHRNRPEVGGVTAAGYERQQQLQNDHHLHQQRSSHSTSHPYQNLVTISRFMADYRARKVLAFSNMKTSGSSSRDSGVRTNSNTSETGEGESAAEDYYASALRDFAQTQLDRQKAGLGTNANVESSDGLVQLVQSHASALNAAMIHAGNDDVTGTFKIPSKEVICSWHALLCPNHPQSGRFRSSQAKAGNTIFCPSQDLDSEMGSFALAMECLHSRWSNQILVGISGANSAGPQTEESLITSTYYCVALAAIVLYSILDIHSFADGNGRMGRICTNWVLRKVLGLPFTVTITANPSQRLEYTAGLKNALWWIQCLKDVDPTNPDFPRSVTHGRHSSSHIEFGIFQDLIYMLLDRIAHACNECQRVVTEKSQAATAHEEARIARRVRERAAAGQCVICLEDNPNILTICCGQAIHLNCLAEWLGTASNCVACRQALPTLQVRQHNQENSVPDEDGHDGQLIEPINAHSNPRNDVWNSVLTNMLWEAAESADVIDCDNHGCSNRAATNCVNFMCRVCCQAYGEEYCSRHGEIIQQQPQSQIDEMNTTTTEEQPEPAVTDTSTATDDEPVSPRSQSLPVCRRCSNRAAVDCENQMCGRHCALNGWFDCDRHNTIRQYR